LIYLVTNEQLNENCHTKFPVGNSVGLARTQNCRAWLGLFASTMLRVMIRMSSGHCKFEGKAALTEHIITFIKHLIASGSCQWPQTVRRSPVLHELANAFIV